MKFLKLDTVQVLSGTFKGHKGRIVGFSQIHRDSIPDMADYQVQFLDIRRTEEVKEDNLALVERYDAEKAEKERQEKIQAERAEAQRQQDLKLEEALRQKIRREYEIREEIEKEMAAKKAAAQTSS